MPAGLVHLQHTLISRVGSFVVDAAATFITQGNNVAMIIYGIKSP
jgi:hypothetical protein